MYIFLNFKINKVNNNQDLFLCLYLRFIILSLVSCYFFKSTNKILLSDFFSLFFENLKWNFYKKINKNQEKSSTEF